MSDKRSTKRAIRGTGSVFHDKARDRYRGKVTIDGETFTVYARTKTGARTKLNELIRDGGGRKVDEPREPGVTVAEVVASFLERELAGRERAPSTIELHHWAARIIVEHIGDKRAETLRVRQVDDMLDALAEQGLSRSTMLRVRNTLSQSLDYARKREDITRNAARDATIPAQARRTAERTALSPTDARTLLDALRRERNGLVFALSLRLGLRPGEAAGLHWSDVGADFVNVTRAVRKVGGRVEVIDELKTSAAKRTIGLPADLAAWFAEHRKTQAAERLAATSWADDGLVFASPTGNVLDPSNGRRLLADICQRAGVPLVKPNELRHSCASLLADAGVMHEEIADLLGHTTTAMVEATYRHRLRPVIDVAARTDWATG